MRYNWAIISLAVAVLAAGVVKLKVNHLAKVEAAHARGAVYYQNCPYRAKIEAQERLFRHLSVSSVPRDQFDPILWQRNQLVAQIRQDLVEKGLKVEVKQKPWFYYGMKALYGADTPAPDIWIYE